MPKRPPTESSSYVDRGELHMRLLSNEFIAPRDPTERPVISRAAGMAMGTFYADVWQEAGGQLTPQEAAGLQRWKDATAANASSAMETGPWVTMANLDSAGLIENPYHVQVTLGKTEYGRYTSRLYKGITKAFFPKTHQALEAVKQAGSYEEYYGDDSDNDDSNPRHKEALDKLAAAVAADVDGEEKQKEVQLKEAKQWVDALAGNREALMAIMTDQSANPYGPAAGDEGEEDGDSDASGDEDDADAAYDLLDALRAGSAMDFAAMFGVGP